MPQRRYNRKCATVIGPSPLVRAPPTEGGQEKNRPKDVKLGAFDMLRPIVEHGKCRAQEKSGLSRSFLAFMGKCATHHRRPYTSRTPGRSTPNDGRNRKHQRRAIPRSRRFELRGS